MNRAGDGSLESALGALKANGASVLIAGPAPDEYIDRVSASHLGAERADAPRRRCFALFARDPAVAQDRLELIDETLELTQRQLLYSSPDRSTAAKPASRTPRTGCPIGSVSLSSIVDTVTDSVITERSRRTLSPGQYRLCVDSLVPLLDNHGLQNTIAFVNAVNDVVYDANGQVHYVLPLALDDEPTRALKHEVDVFVPLQARHGEIQYRFELTDRDRLSDVEDGLTTAWQPVDEVR